MCILVLRPHASRYSTLLPAKPNPGPSVCATHTHPTPAPLLCHPRRATDHPTQPHPTYAYAHTQEATPPPHLHVEAPGAINASGACSPKGNAGTCLDVCDCA
jgi:hypothetical protein